MQLDPAHPDWLMKLPAGQASHAAIMGAGAYVPTTQLTQAAGSDWPINGLLVPVMAVSQHQGRKCVKRSNIAKSYISKRHNQMNNTTLTFKADKRRQYEQLANFFNSTSSSSLVHPPAGHEAQASGPTPPVVGLYVPAPHLEHMLAPPLLYCPLAHSWATPAKHDEPAGQGSATVEPAGQL